MEKVKIQRRKRKKKKISTKDKVLAGIGVGSTLMGGVGAVAPKPPTTQFVRTQATPTTTTAGKIKSTLKKIFGVKKAKASELYSYDLKDNGDGTYTITLDDPEGTSLTVSSRNELASKSQKYNTTDAEDIKKFGSFVQAFNNWNSILSLPDSITAFADSQAAKNGTPTVTELLSVPGWDFTVGWWDQSQAVGTGELNKGEPYNILYYANDETTQFLANALGGQVTVIKGPTTGPFSWPDQPAIKLPNGEVLNAGVVAQQFQRFQQQYRGSIENYKLNLEQNSAIVGTGYLQAPIDPITALKSYFVEGNANASASMGSTTGIDYTQPYLPGSPKALEAQVNLPSAVILNKTSGNTSIFKVGDKWEITVKGAPNTDVYVVGGIDGEQVKNKMGRTDANGILKLSGTISSDQAGDWNESWYVGNDKVGQIDFTVVEKTTAVSSDTSYIDAQAAKNGTPTVTELLSVPGWDFTVGWWDQSQAVGTGELNKGEPYNILYYANDETTQFLANALGGQVTVIKGPTTGPFSWPDQPAIKLPNGEVLNAGVVAQQFQRFQQQYRGSIENYKLNLEQNSAIVGTGYLQAPIDPITALKSYFVEGNANASASMGSTTGIDYTQSAGQTGSNFGIVNSTASATVLPVGTSLGKNPNAATANKTVYISHVTAFNHQGKNVGAIIRPGDTIEIGGTGLEVYSQFHLVVGSQEFQIGHATITNNKITLTVPTLGSVPNNASIRIRLISSSSNVSQGVLPQYFIYQSSQQTATGAATSGQAQTVTYGQGTTTSAAAGGQAQTVSSGQQGGQAQTGSGLLSSVASGGAATSTEAAISGAQGQQQAAAAGISDAQIAEYEQALQNLTSQVNNMQNQLNSLADQLEDDSDAQEEIAALRKEITGLRSDVASLNNLVNQLKVNRVQTFSQVDGLATGLQMPAGYSASVGGLQMPAGFPASAAYAASPSVQAASTGQVSKTYKVKKGDTLWAIAKKQYGDGKQWRKILEVNPDCLSRPSNTRTLKVGYELVIPE